MPKKQFFSLNSTLRVCSKFKAFDKMIIGRRQIMNQIKVGKFIAEERKKKNYTQCSLAEKLFVSRSTVAKWENGLGLPNPESMTALHGLFGITSEDISTEEPECVIVTKNRRLHLIGQIVG